MTNLYFGDTIFLKTNSHVGNDLMWVCDLLTGIGYRWAHNFDQTLSYPV